MFLSIFELKKTFQICIEYVLKMKMCFLKSIDFSGDCRMS